VLTDIHSGNHLSLTALLSSLPVSYGEKVRELAGLKQKVVRWIS
jgi:hypothetical protein